MKRKNIHPGFVGAEKEVSDLELWNATLRIAARSGRQARRARALAGLIGVALLAGCFSVPIPQAAADPARFFVLSTTTPPASREVATPAPTVHLRPVDVANYLRSRSMIVRRGPNEIEFREFALWGEPLEEGVVRVLREELLARGAASDVLAGGIRAPGSDGGVILLLRLLACEGSSDGSVLFHAIWELSRTKPEADRVARGDYAPTHFRWDGKSEASLAAQLSAAVAGLVGEIATALPKAAGAR